MFYFLMIPVICYLAYQAYQLLDLKKHDKCLYRFCELRRDSIKFLDQEYKNLSRNDYVALRKLIDALNITINNYKNHKTILFNFRLFASYLKEFKNLEDRTDKISTNNAHLNNLKCRMQFAIFESFLAYTPFLKSEIIVTLVARLLSVAMLSGIRSFNGYLQNVNEASSIIKHFKNSSLCNT